MTVIVAELPTVDVSIGFGPDDIVSAGDSFSKRFQTQDPDDCVFADFTGFTATFDLLDSAGTIVISGTVLPAAGDTSGTWTVGLTGVQTAANVDEFAYRLRITDGAVTKVLFCGQFKITLCAAAA